MPQNASISRSIGPGTPETAGKRSLGLESPYGRDQHVAGPVYRRSGVGGA